MRKRSAVPAPRKSDLDTLQRAWEQLNSRMAGIESDGVADKAELLAMIEPTMAAVKTIQTAPAEQANPVSPSSGGGGSSPTTCFTINGALKLCTVSFGNDVGIIYGTVDASPGIAALVLSPGEPQTQTGGLRAIAIDPGTLVLNDVTFFGLFSTSTYELNCTAAKSFHFFTTNSTLNIGDSTGDISYQGLAGGMQFTALGTQTLFRSSAYVDEMRFRDFDASSDLTIFDHISFAANSAQIPDQGGAILLDQHVSFFGSHQGSGSLNTRRGLYLREMMGLDPRVAMGIEMDRPGSNASDEEWAYKSHGGWFYNRGQAIFGSSAVASTTVADTGVRGNAFIDVTDASTFAAAGVIRMGFISNSTLAIPFDRYFVYSSITLGGGAGGSDRINLTQNITHQIEIGSAVFQYTTPDEAQVEIWNGDAARIGLIVNGASGQTANLQEWRDDSGTVLLAVDALGNLSGSIDSGVFTPTPSAGVNLDSITMNDVQWMRVGTTVTVSGNFDADPTTTLLTTSFEMDLPIASNLSGDQLAGTAARVGGTHFASVEPNAGTDSAVVTWVNLASTAGARWYFHFTYQII